MAMPREVKVGAFVLAGLAAMGVVIFLIGDERGLFSPKTKYAVVFEDVQGLKQGNTVRMGGVDVGSVSEVTYSSDSHDSRLYVTLNVDRDAARRIRTDSVAKIEGKGLLGDKMITVTIGSVDLPAVEPGGTIRADESGGFEQMMSQVGRISDRAEKVMKNLETTTGTFADQKFRDDLKSTVASVSGILKSLNEGDGYVGRLLRDPKEADQLSRVVASLEQTSQELSHLVHNANAVVEQVESGPGMAHEVLYGEESAKTVGQFGDAAEEVALSLRGIREGTGPAKSLLYGDEHSEQVMSNLGAMSQDLRQIVADVRAGKGTLGALLVDPSVYEDIKLVLGNVERNRTLRALVRYSIESDEGAPEVEVRDPRPTVTPKKR